MGDAEIFSTPTIDGGLEDTYLEREKFRKHPGGWNREEIKTDEKTM
jgi:hypothetical protein